MSKKIKLIAIFLVIIIIISVCGYFFLLKNKNIKINKEKSIIEKEIIAILDHKDEIASIHIGLSSYNKDSVIYYIYGDG